MEQLRVAQVNVMDMVTASTRDVSATLALLDPTAPKVSNIVQQIIKYYKNLTSDNSGHTCTIISILT